MHDRCETESAQNLKVSSDLQDRDKLKTNESEKSDEELKN